MKRTLLILSAVFVLYSLSAQSILITDENNSPVSNDQVVVLHEEPGHSDILSHFDVKNNTSSSMDIMCKKKEVSLINGSTNSFCWAQCYPPFTYVSPTPITLGAGQSDTNSFLGEYYPNGNSGISTIAYTFFDGNNTNDSVRVIVEYAFNVVGLEELFARGDYSFSAAYPNPASASTSFDYELPAGGKAYVSIMNLLGSEVKQLELSGLKGKATLNTSDLNEGVYFYTLYIGGQGLSTHKLVVKR